MSNEASSEFIDLNLHALNVGVPAQLLQNRPDIRQAERELAAAGLDVKVARARFFPSLDITAGVGYEAFNTKYLFTSPESLIYNVAGDLVGAVDQQEGDQGRLPHAPTPCNCRAVYNYQRVGPQCLHRGHQPHGQGGELRPEHRDQEAAVGMRSRPRSTVATKLFQNATCRIHGRAAGPA